MSPSCPVASAAMTTDVLDVPARSRYEVTVAGELAGFAAYEQVEGARVFTHTEVYDAYEGKGVGGTLARGALDDVRAHGRLIHPFCPYVRSWIAKHPEYRELVDDPERFHL